MLEREIEIALGKFMKFFIFEEETRLEGRNQKMRCMYPVPLNFTGDILFF